MKKNNKSFIGLIFYVCGATLLAGCSDEKDVVIPQEEVPTYTNTLSGDGAIYKPQKNDELKALGLSEQLTQCQSGINDFSVRLFKSIASSNSSENKVISAFSVSQNMAMLANGAMGDTKAEIINTIFGGVTVTCLNEFYNTVNPAFYAADKKCDLISANGLWINNDEKFSQAFVDKMRRDYWCNVELLDFSKEQESVSIINQWAYKETNGLIPNILDELPHQLNSVLASALYFKGEWAEPFITELTTKGKFITSTGTEISTDFMKGFTSYIEEGENYKVITLPYGNGFYEMTLILPDEGSNVQNIIANLSATDILGTSLLNGRKADVSVSLPKFDIEVQKYNLTDYLKEMGVQKMFDLGSRDFRNMMEKDPGFDRINHFCTLSVDEYGTQAAAVTVTTTETSTGEDSGIEKIQLIFDRPFIFAITSRFSNSIFFMGVMNNPAL